MLPYTNPQLVTLFATAILAITFLQSSIDKITDYKGNLDWLYGHFSKSIFKNLVQPLLISLTIFELSSGLFNAFAIVQFIFFSEFSFFQLSLTLNAITLCMLFFGQRLAKDYAGAATIVSYVILTLIGLYCAV